MVLKDFSEEYGQENNMHMENVVTQLLPLWSCLVGDARSASAAAWAGQSAMHRKMAHFSFPTQSIEKEGC